MNIHDKELSVVVPKERINIMQEFLGRFETEMSMIMDKSVKMIFADFPYNTTQIEWDRKGDLDLKKFWEESERVLVDNGVIICTSQFPFTMNLLNSNLGSRIKFRYDWIWQKTSATGHLNAKKMPLKGHEIVLVFYKSLPTYNPQKTQGHKRKVSSAKSKEGCKESEVYNKGQKMTDYDSTERYPTSVITFASDKQRMKLINPTQKPEALVEYFVKTYTNEGDLVLDPCRGSNTSGVVCDRLNRRYVGIEADSEQFYLGINRREDAKKLTKN